MIKVLHYERVNKNKIIGYVDVEVNINGVSHILRRINHIQHLEKKWFNFSTFKREHTDGKVEYLPFHELGIKVHNTKLLEALHEAVEKYCLENKIASIPPLNLGGESDIGEKDWMGEGF